MKTIAAQLKRSKSRMPPESKAPRMSACLAPRRLPRLTINAAAKPPAGKAATGSICAIVHKPATASVVNIYKKINIGSR